MSVRPSSEKFCVRFNSSGRVAQLVEQCPFKAWVEGSSPSALTIPCAAVVSAGFSQSLCTGFFCGFVCRP